MSSVSRLRLRALAAGVVLLGAASGARAGTNTWTGSGGPSVAALTTMLVTGTSPARILITPRSGRPGVVMAYSTDGGVTFALSAATNLPPVATMGLAAVSGTPTTLLAAMGNQQGAWKSTDTGDTWTSAGLGGKSLRCLTTDPASAQIAFACGATQLFRSTDQGSNWTGVSPVAGSTTTAIAVDPTSHLRVYAGFQNANHFYVSTDGGSSWTPGANLAVAPNVIRVDSTTPTTLYAGIGGGLFKSTNGGGAWTASGLVDLIVRDLVIDPGSASTLLAGTSTGMFRSTDAGGTWAPASGSLFTGLRVNNVAADASTAGLFFATTEAGFSRSTDHGATWSALTIGGAVAPWSVAGDTGSANAFYMGTTGGFYRSTDDGTTFADRSAGLPDRFVTTILTEPANALSVLVGTGGAGAQRSTDGGLTWAASSSGLTDPSVRGFARDPVTPSLVYAATGAGVFRSTDSGATWALPSADLNGHGIQYVAIDPVTTSTLYAGNSSEATALLWKSTNGGGSWQELTSFPGKVDGSTLTWRVAVASNHAVYAGTDASLYRSTNGGTSFTNVTAGLVNPFIDDILVDTPAATSLVVATDGGVFRSLDSGAHWAPLMTGLDELGATALQTLGKSPVDPSKLFAGVINYGAFGYRIVPQGSNLATNAGFDANVSDWVAGPVGFGVEWSNLDANGNGGSGSARVFMAAGVAGLAPTLVAGKGAASQGCTGLTPRDRVSYGAKVFIPTGQGTTGSGNVVVTWYSDPFCSGAAQISTSGTPGVTQTGAWTLTSLAHQMPPLGTKGARLSIAISADTVGPGFVVNFDDVSFVADRHGDLNVDGQVNVTDVFYLINFLFAGGPAPVGPSDVNGDGNANVADVFYLINFLFAGGAPPL